MKPYNILKVQNGLVMPVYRVTIVPFAILLTSVVPKSGCHALEVLECCKWPLSAPSEALRLMSSLMRSRPKSEISESRFYVENKCSLFFCSTTGRSYKDGVNGCTSGFPLYLSLQYFSNPSGHCKPTQRACCWGIFSLDCRFLHSREQNG